MYTRCTSVFECIWMYLIHPPVQHAKNSWSSTGSIPLPQKALNKSGPATACQNLWYHLLMTAPWLSTGKKHRWRGRARFKKRYKFIKPRVVVMKTKRGEQKVSNLIGNEDPCLEVGRQVAHTHISMGCHAKKTQIKGENVSKDRKFSTSVDIHIHMQLSPATTTLTWGKG